MLANFLTKHKYKFLAIGGISGSTAILGLCGLFIFMGNTENISRLLDNNNKNEDIEIEELPQSDAPAEEVLEEVIEEEEEQEQLQDPVPELVVEQEKPKVENLQPQSAPVSDKPSVSKGPSGSGYEVRIMRRVTYGSTYQAYSEIKFTYDSEPPTGVGDGNWGEGSIGATWEGLISANDTTGAWAKNEEKMYSQLQKIGDQDLPRYFDTYNFKEAYDTIKEKKTKGESLDGNTLRETCKVHYHRKDTKTSDPLSEDMRKWCIDYSQNHDRAHT